MSRWGRPCVMVAGCCSALLIGAYGKPLREQIRWLHQCFTLCIGLIAVAESHSARSSASMTSSPKILSPKRAPGAPGQVSQAPRGHPVALYRPLAEQQGQGAGGGRAWAGHGRDCRLGAPRQQAERRGGGPGPAGAAGHGTGQHKRGGLQERGRAGRGVRRAGAAHFRVVRGPAARGAHDHRHARWGALLV